MFGMRGPWWLAGTRREPLQHGGVGAEEEGSVQCLCAEPGQEQTGRAAGLRQRASAGRMCSAPRADLSHLSQTLQGPSSPNIAPSLLCWGGGARVPPLEVPRDGPGCRGVVGGSHRDMG